MYCYNRAMSVKSWFFALGGIILSLLFLAHGLGPFYEDGGGAMAYEASSSTNFFLHGGGLDSIAKIGSSSTSFIEYAAGGQAIIGRASSSVSFISLKGIIYPMFRTFAGAATLTLTIDGTCDNDGTCDLNATANFGTLGAGTANDSNVRIKTDSTTTITLAIGRKRASPTTTLASSAATSINISDTAGGIDVFAGCPSTATVTWKNGSSTGLGYSLWAATENKDTTCWGTGTGFRLAAADANKYAALQASTSASTAWTTTSSGIKYASIGFTLDVTTSQRSTTYTGDTIFTATTVP